jgi:hypothetical protein
MNIMNIDRVQGLIDLHAGGKTRNAVLVMADYLMRQGLISQADVDAVVAALDAYDATQEHVNLRAALEEREQLRADLDTVTAERDALKAAQKKGGLTHGQA